MKKSDINHLRRLLGWVRCDIGQSPAELQQTMIDVADGLGHPDISPEAKTRMVESYRRAESIPLYVRAAVKALEKTLAAGGRDRAAENDASAAAEPPQNHPNAAAYGIACRDTAAPPTPRRDEAGGAGAAHRNPTARAGKDGARVAFLSDKPACLSDSAKSDKQDADVALPPHWQAFALNHGWNTWEQLIPSAADSPGAVKAYTADQLRATVLADRQQRAGNAAHIAQLRAALILARDSHGVSLLTDPPQDAWKARNVDEVIRAALAAGQGEGAGGGIC